MKNEQDLALQKTGFSSLNKDEDYNFEIEDEFQDARDSIYIDNDLIKF